MAASRILLLFGLLSALIFSEITADVLESETTAAGDAGIKADVSDSSLKIEIDQLKSKLSLLESSIDERTRELTSKDEKIKQLEKVIQEKATTMASMQNEIQLLQEKGSFDVKEQVGKAHARASELEKQVENLRKEIETQNKKKAALVTRADEAEKKLQELNLKLEKLQTINDEQKARIRKTERALEVTEEEMMKAKLEATYSSKRLTEVQDAWFPPWLAVHCQVYLVTKWKQHGQPALDMTIQKASEVKAHVEKFMEPHIDALRTKWIPLIKERLSAFASDMEPHVQMLSASTVSIYQDITTNVNYFVVEVQKMVNPHFQEAKKFTKPYIDLISTTAKPHIDAARVVLKPYTKKVKNHKFVKTATKYHHQVQGKLLERLGSHELTKSLATKELVWFMASVLMALPLILLVKITSAIFCPKPKKQTRTSRSSHARRRGKRVHVDN